MIDARAKGEPRRAAIDFARPLEDEGSRRGSFRTTRENQAPHPALQADSI